MKYLQLFTNRYSLALLIILLLAMLCLMSSSEFTAAIIVTKILGFVLIYVYARLWKRWDKKGHLEFIKSDIIGDPEEQQINKD